MVAHLHPTRGSARDVFSRSAALLVITPVGEALPPSEAVIRGLFDFTPAEARVALGLATGLDLEAIARLSRIADPAQAKDFAIFALATLSGAMALARATRGCDPETSTAILEAALRALLADPRVPATPSA